MEASKLFVPGTAVTWEERVKQLEEVERQLQQRLQEYEKPAGGPKIRTAFHWVIEAPKTVSWEKYTEALNASAARWRKRLADVEADLAQSTRDVAELNGRLIERQESFLAQVVRIEETWRERLREKVGLVWREPGENSPCTTGKYLVELHDGTHTMVRVEETFEEYEDGTPADRSEWRAWVEVPKQMSNAR